MSCRSRMRHANEIYDWLHLRRFLAPLGRFKTNIANELSVHLLAIYNSDGQENSWAFHSLPGKFEAFVMARALGGASQF